MKVLYALLCEDARERGDSRLDVHGVFHQLYAPGFPAQQDRFTLAVAIEWEAHEQGRIEFAIDLVDPNRAPVISITGHTEVGERQPLMGPPQTRLLMPLENIPFPEEGTYFFELKVGDTRLPLAPLHLIHDTALH